VKITNISWIIWILKSFMFHLTTKETAVLVSHLSVNPRKINKNCYKYWMKRVLRHDQFVAGNLLIHPFLEKWKDSVEVPNAVRLNECGLYIGNSQFINIEMIHKVFTAIQDKW